MIHNQRIKFIDFIVYHPVKSIILSLLLVIIFALGLGKLSTDFTYRAFFAADNPLRIEVEEFEKKFSNDDSVVLMVRSESGIFDQSSAELINLLTKEMWKVPDIVRVDSIGNYRWVHAADDEIVVEPLLPDETPYSDSLLQERKAIADKDEIIPDYLLSKDGKTTMIVGYARPALEQAVDAEPVINAVREIVKKYQSGDHEFHITGRLAVMQAMKESSQADTKARLPLVMGIIVLVLLVTFRHAGAIMPSMVLIVGSVICTMGIAGWLGIKISNITAVVPQFIIAICIANALHILTSYFQLRNKYYDRKVAATEALTKNLLPTILTSSTTAVGFFSLLSSEVVAISDLGVIVGFGTIVAWIITYFFIGAVVGVLPNKKGGEPAKLEIKDSVEYGLASTSGTVKYINFVERNKFLIIAFFLLTTLGSIFIASKNTFNANPFKYFAEGYWLREANDFSEKYLSGSQGIEVVVDAREADGIKSPEFLNKVNDYQEWINTIPGVVKTFSIVDVVKQSHRSMNNDDPAYYRLPDSRETISELIFLYSLNLPQGLDLSNRVTLANDALRITVKWTNYDSAKATYFADQIEQRGKELGLDVTVTGKMILFQRMNGYVSKSFLESTLLTVVLMGIIIILALKSVKLGILSLACNLIPLCIGMAVLQITGFSIDIGAVVVLSVCLGVAVDDTTHFVSHAKVLMAKGLSPVAVVQDTILKVGPAITLTTFILICAFGLFVTADFVPNANFGRMSIAILGSAWLIQFTLLPALLLLGKTQEQTGIITEQKTADETPGTVIQ
ncbi:MAG: putative integral rane protein [Cellvibrio sp.]|jgi:predicted RND superfamily exporter protein|nr:putative integral rane protein [Cellvibrio sp.]